MRRFKRLRPGVDAVSASEYNALVETVENLAKSLPGHSVISGGQIATRMDVAQAGTTLRIGEVVTINAETGVATISPVRAAGLDGTFLRVAGYDDPTTHITAYAWGEPPNVPAGTIVQVWDALDADDAEVTFYTVPPPAWSDPTGASDGMMLQARTVGGVMRGVWDWPTMRG